MSNRTESSLLTQLLLPPAPLPTIIPPSKFTTLFPSSLRANSQIPLFYRDLQYQRALQIDAVRKNIFAEAKRGEGMKREVVRTRRRAERESLGLGLDIEEDGGMEGLISNMNGRGKSHTLTSVLPELEGACDDLEIEIAELMDQAGRLLSEMQNTVEGLGGLKYGTFAAPIEEEVLNMLKPLISGSSESSGA